MFHEHLDSLYRGPSGRWETVFRESGYNPGTVRRTKHRIEKEHIAAGNIWGELVWECVRRAVAMASQTHFRVE